jgi:SprT protein
LQNPAASSCGDEKLLRVLHNYDEKAEGIHLVEQLPEGGLFSIKGGRIFRKGEKVRKRYKCVEVKTGKLYLFSPVYEVVAL